MTGRKFISVSEAQKLISSSVRAGGKTLIPLPGAAGCVLSQSIKSNIQSPPFHQSAMDGFAFRFSDLAGGGSLHIAGVVRAGESFHGTLKRGQAIRIFTGASVPKGADTVVMQEKTEVHNDELSIADALLKKGANIRKAGSQLRKNETAVKAGTVLNPGSIGFLASIGITRISVFKKPKVGIIVTGDELITPGRPLRDGSIYESNAVMLREVLSREGVGDVHVIHVEDHYSNIRSAFKQMLKKCDVVLFTGGISVGEYDFTGKVVEDEGVRCVFYKVKQKPGKPLYFGKKDSKYIFGLPGNPASVLTCYYEYVLPAIRLFQRHPNPFLPVLQLPVFRDVFKKPGLTVFLKGTATGSSVDLLPGQESYILKSFHDANAFIVMREDDLEIRTGTNVEVHLFGELASV